MLITIAQTELYSVLSTVFSAIEKKTTLPILCNLLLSSKGNILTVTATDLEIEQIAVASLISSEEDSSITIPARKLIDIVKMMPEDKIITLKLIDTLMEVKCGRSKYKLTTIDAKDFPDIGDHYKALHSFKMTVKELHALFSDGTFAMANQDVRYYLNGALLKTTPDSLEVVSTDGHRMATKKHFMNTGVNETIDCIIPRKGVLNLQKLLGNLSGDILVELSSNHFRLSSNGNVFTTKLVDGRFPDYKKVIPKNDVNDIRVTINAKLLKTHLSRVSILANEKTHGVRMSFSENTLSLQANNPEQEESEEVLDINYSGVEFNIGFNVSYLLDAINHVNTDEVVMLLKDANSTIRILPTDESALSCVMPLRL